MNREYYTEGIAYSIVKDNTLPKTIHPCDVCDLKIKCTSGIDRCHDRKIHFVRK